MTRSERREMWASHVESYHASGLTAAAWCEESGLNKFTLKNWIRKFNREKLFQTNPQWIAVGRPSEDPPAGMRSLAISIGRTVIEVPPGFDPPSLEKVIRILSELC